MTKYDEATRYRIVEEYLGGVGGIKALAKKHGVGRTQVKRWVDGYRLHGKQGLSKKRGVYSAELKLQILEHMWRDELSYGQASTLYDLRESGAISRWERQYHEGGIEALKPKRKGRPPKMPNTPTPLLLATEMAGSIDERTREELLKENEYLRAEVAYLKKLDELLRQKAQAAKPRALKPTKQRKS